MKNRNTLFGISFVGISMLLYLITPTITDENSTYSPRVKHANGSYSNNVQGIAGAMDYYAARRINLSTGKMDLDAMIKADNDVRNFGQAQKTVALGLNWTEMGPDNVGGRTRAILIDRFNPARVYAGSVSGGLFISNTYGYSWSAYDDGNQNLAVCAITQTTNGDIYFGTGESFTGANGQGTLGTPGVIGRGVFKSTDGGLTFTQLPATLPTNLNLNTGPGSAWAFVNRLAADPVDPLKVWAATNSGLYYTLDSGSTWTVATCSGCPSSPSFSTSSFQDVKIASDGTIGASYSSTAVMLPAGQTDFVWINSRLSGVSASRIEFAFAPSNPNYLYVCAINGSDNLNNIYQSKNGGASFTIIVPGDPNPTLEDPLFSGQGGYDLLLGVFPDNPEHVLVGGLALYAWNGPANTWGPVALTGTGNIGGGLYVHADKHIVAFSPNYSSDPYYYVGTDGGVSVFNINGDNLFRNFNTGYNVTQFYAIGTSREGWVAGGTQDNGNPFIDFTGNTSKSEVRNLPSGDGGYMQFSVINPAAFFWESQGGQAKRSPDYGILGTQDVFFENIVMCAGDCDDGADDGAWATPLVIWESFNDTASKENVEFVVKQSYSAGETIYVPSNNNDFPFEYVTPVPVSVGDTLLIKDLVQSKFFVGLNSGIWMCKNVLDFSDIPEWYKLTSDGGATCLEVSKDGDVIFVGIGWQGMVLRISGINGILPGDPSTKTSPSSLFTPTIIHNSSQILTGLSVDPNNANNLIITKGNYGSTNYVYRSTNALGAASLTSIQGNLPPMPIYDALIEMHDPNRIILATEYGIFTTENGMDPTPVWTEENTGMSRVPSFMLIQQLHENDNCTGVTNSGVIYVGTHGRGIFKETMYANAQATEVCKLPVGIEDPVVKPAIEMAFYPNPVVNGNGNLNFTMQVSEIVMLKIYDISGKLVDAVALGRMAAGEHTVTVPMNELGAGTYFVQLTSAGASATTKVMVVE